MKNIIKQLILTAVMLLATVDTTKAEDNTKLSGFAIGDKLEDVVTYCRDTLKYEIGVQGGVDELFLIACYPALDPSDKEYPELTRGKPEAISILGDAGYVVGLHLVFTKKLTYKKVLADFVSSGIMKEEPVKDIEDWGPRYINHKQNWHGWHYAFTNPKDTKQKIYVIHLEKVIPKTTEAPVESTTL